MERTHRIALLIALCLTLAIAGLAAPALAQEDADGEGEGDQNATNETVQTIEHQLGNSDIIEVDWNGQTAHLTIEAHTNARIAVTDSGAVDNLGSDASREIRFETFRIPAGQTREIVFTVEDDPLITVQEGGVMIAASGDRSLVDVITGAATVQLIRWSAVSGIVGTLLATAASIGLLKRRHQNSYRELTNDERHRIERDPVDGVLGRLKRFLLDHYVLLSLLVLTFLYLGLWIFGHLPGPIDVWSSLSDTERVIVTGALATFLVAFAPAFALVSRIWDPDLEFILDVDVDDLIQSNRGIEPEQGGFAVYSGPPSRVRDMDLRNADSDAGKSKSESPGGRAVVVRDLDPKENEATGTWPGQASDEELVREQALIRDNRNQLQQAAELGKNLLRQVSSIAISSEIASTRGIDAALRDSATVDADPLNEILENAAEGTDWEDYFDPDDPEDEDEDADHSDEPDASNDEDEDTNDEETNQ